MRATSFRCSMPVSRLGNAMAPVLVLMLASGLALSACGSSAPAAPPANQGLLIDRPTPQAVPLVNQKGQPVSLAGLRGKDVVMAPFLTLCQDECPLVTGAFASLQRDVDAAGLGQKVVFVEITVDPGRDTVARLSAYRKEFGADWDLWTGTPANLATFWKAFGVGYQIVPEAQPPHIDWLTGKPLTYDVDHTDGYILINASGHERFVDATAPNLGGHLDKKLTSLLNAGGVYGLNHPQAANWTINEALAAISWLVGTNIPAVGSP
jgi:protein SCO1